MHSILATITGRVVLHVDMSWASISSQCYQVSSTPLRCNLVHGIPVRNIATSRSMIPEFSYSIKVSERWPGKSLRLKQKLILIAPISQQLSERFAQYLLQDRKANNLVAFSCPPLSTSLKYLLDHDIIVKQLTEGVSPFGAD